MSLTTITKRREPRRITTYDFEWIPKELKIRLCGAYDERMGYRHYSTIEEFLEGELVSDNAGRWYYAHAGGLADIQFVLEKLVDKPQYQVDASFSASSAIIVHVRKGDDTWNFIDSLWLLRGSLKAIGSAVGLEKMRSGYKCSNYPHCGHPSDSDGDTHCIFYAPMKMLIPYNERDCEILWRAITEFESAVLDLGGELQMTIASTAMRLFRRRYLQSSIHNDEAVNNLARKAYVASRVEVFQRKCARANYYDINSSFPYSMTKPHPGSVISYDGTKLPPPGVIYIADVEVEVPEMYLPPVPHRRQGRVYFPTGKWRQWFSSVDVELMERRGCKIRKIHQVVTFESRTDLAAYAQDLYEKRQKAKTPFEKVVYKFLLNSLYGKFAETREKSSLLLNPKSTECPHTPAHPGNACLEPLFPGAFIMTADASIEHEWVPISVHITALSRGWLEGYLHDCQGEDRDGIYYCDTDSVITTATLPTSSELGGLKLEYTVADGEFIAPKVYRVDDHVRAKGFSRMNVEKFYQLRDGVEIGIERMVRVKELFRSGVTAPHEKIFGKRYRGRLRPKRRYLYDGNTRPWSIEDLDRKWDPGPDSTPDGDADEVCV